MRAAPFPADETRRQRTLAALGVLDTAPEAFSQSVAAAAAAIANVPAAAVSLVDTDRQWFKGSCGLGLSQTSRDVAFCAYTILDTRPFIVADARLDERFADNPLVTGEPYVRFYAGFPLTVEQRRLGALCVIDDRPRTLTAGQIEQLSRLAEGTAAWLAGYSSPERGR